MGTLASSPRPLRGAIVAVEATSPLSRAVVFQYNPDEVTRTLAPREAGEGSAAKSSPNETLGFTVELDATDALLPQTPVVHAAGVLPALSTLEMLLHPSSVDVILRAALLAAGTIEITPPSAPQAVLVLGPARIVPIKITNLQITESAHNPGLVPIRASVQIGATVLTHDDLSVASLGFGLSLAHLVAKEIAAVAGSAQGAASAITDLVA